MHNNKLLSQFGINSIEICLIRQASPFLIQSTMYMLPN